MSGRIPQSFINELLLHTPIVDLISEYLSLKKAGSRFVACCPFHQENSPSFNVIPNKQFYHCFGCGANGNAIGFLMQYLNQGFVEAVEILAAKLNLVVIREGEDSSKEQKSSALALYQLLDKVSKFYQHALKNNKIAIEYLQQRGLDGKIAKAYQLGYAPQDWHRLEGLFPNQKDALLATGMLIQKENTDKTYDRFRHRILFPIHDVQGRIVGFGGRALDPQQKPKYLNSPETSIFQKSSELYGLYQLIKQKKHWPYLLVVEGYMDVIALAQHEGAPAVAALGTSIHSFQIQVLSKYSPRIFFCFDGDNAGQQAALKAMEQSLAILDAAVDLRFIFLPEKHDPDSFIREQGQENFKALLDKALPFHDFFLQHLMQSIELSTPAGKNQLLHKVQPYFKKIPAGAYQELLLQDLSRLTHIAPDRLLNLFSVAKAEKTFSPAPQTQRTRRPERSPLHLALSLLLQQPSLAFECQAVLNPNFLQEKKLNPLKQVLEAIYEMPQISTAALVEKWRNTPFFDLLTQLAAFDHQISPEALKNSFIDTILFLEKQNLENLIQNYIEKSRNEGLTNAERMLLQDLLKQCHPASIKN